jgi:flagellar protein FliO/FliZ
VVELAVRLVFSLAVVVGMLLMLAKLSAKRFRGSADSLVRVVHRQPLSRTASVAVVTVGSRVLVLGTTEQQVQLITELDPEELDLEEPGPADLEPADLEPGDLDATPAPARPFAARSAGRHAVPADSALAGSVLSPQTWKQALAAATGREREAS